jgi:hypothetical protein
MSLMRRIEASLRIFISLIHGMVHNVRAENKENDRQEHSSWKANRCIDFAGDQVLIEIPRQAAHHFSVLHFDDCLSHGCDSGATKRVYRPLINP